MKIEKVIETVFLKEWNTTAHILEDDIVVCLWNNVFMNEEECFKYIHEYCKGWVSTTESYRKAIANKEETGAVDCLIRFENLYKNLKEYKTELIK